MNSALLLLAFAALAPAAVQAPAPTVPAVPEAAATRTVAQALCLLGFTTVPLRELATGHHAVEVVLNGRPGLFVLDTGANATVLHAAYLKDFGLGGRRSVRTDAAGLGGVSSADLVPIDGLSIGAVATRQRHILAIDISHVTVLLERFSGGRIHGIIGQDVMKEHRAVVDVRGPAVHLIEADRDPAPVASENCPVSRPAAAPAPPRSGDAKR
ncbi:MAG TPA: retropepsin-like aspartic protease [Allosphingosinicella sp.]|jgi:hypothetical protein